MTRLVLFSRRPERGRVKTRLAVALGPDAALHLYRAFLEDQLRFLHSFRPEVAIELWLDEPWDADAPFAPLLRDVSVHLQGEGDLGRRLLRCFARGPACPTLVLGTDAPSLPAARVVEAFAWLRRNEGAVVVPADDGGYVLIGMDRPHAALFREVPWGHSRVLSVTERRAREAGIALHRLPAWYDVDDVAALTRLRGELQRPEAARRAAATARALEKLIPGPSHEATSTRPPRA